ncbi:hypothetical protein Btru_063497 [Bulinus truncatus]|nr:hypothetical protein Btru_063497 [Bulinus truncatus]
MKEEKKCRNESRKMILPDVIYDGTYRHFFSESFGCQSTQCQRVKLLNVMNGIQRQRGFLPDNTVNVFNVIERMDGVFSEEEKPIISLLFQPIINNHNFKYLLNPTTTCSDSRTETLIVVPSAPGHFEQRLNLRFGDCGNYAEDKENHAKLLFFVGRTNSSEIQSKINDEYGTFNDIVQESFDDTYNNIRFKAVSMLKWARTFCYQAKYVIRNDDDIYMDMISVVDTVRRVNMRYENFIAGRVRINTKPARNVKNKVYMSIREFPEPTYPPFALGGLVGYPMLTVELLYQAALRVEPIWLDDVFITGICRQKVGAKLLNESAFIFRHKDVGNWAQ